jgi:methionyl-tRNA formyltransferase
MRALLIGAVEGTRIAMEVIAAAAGWDLAGLLTLSPTLKGRHSDFADLGEDAARLGAQVVFTDNGNDPRAIAAIERIAPDISFVIGWSQLCGPALVRACGGRMIGYHPAALPRLRGRAAIPWTILLGETITASTLFWVSEAVDEGPILSQRFFHVASDETAASLYAKHMRALVLALHDLLPRLLMGDITGEPQDHRLATWGARRRVEDGCIDWRRPAVEIDRLIRAVGRPYPGAFTFIGEDRLAIWSASLSPDGGRHHAAPGQVVAADTEGFSVLCGDGVALSVGEYESNSGISPRLHAMLGRVAA